MERDIDARSKMSVGGSLLLELDHITTNGLTDGASCLITQSALPFPLNITSVYHITQTTSLTTTITTT